MEESAAGSGARTGPVLLYGFGTTVAMWFAGYVCRLPPVDAPGPVLAALLVAAVPVGGWFAGRATGRVSVALLAGLLSAALNLLILGSLLASPEAANRLKPGAVIWVPGFLAAGAALAGAGGLAGVRFARRGPPGPLTGSFAGVTAAATFLLVTAGGLVTGREAGMDVPDWPSSFGYNMFLYPLSRMTGGVYYEHAHRLFGTLVGLSSLVLMIWLLRADRRRGVRGLGLAVFLAVVAQGVLGGLRVTEDSRALAAVHAVFGQLIFAALVGLAAACSARWLSDGPARPAKGARTDRKLSVWFLAVVAVQVALGALVRQLDRGLHVHISLAVVVFFLGLVVGLRAWGLYPDLRDLRRPGVGLLVLVVLQLALGVAAWAAAGAARGAEVPPLSDVLVTTAHQATAALILGAGALLAFWSRRAIRPE